MRRALGAVSIAWMLGCGGLLRGEPPAPQPVTAPAPAPPLVVVVPAPEPEPSPARLEIHFGSPEEGDAVWAEGVRMDWAPDLGPDGTWVLDTEPGLFEIVIRDGVQRHKRALENDLEVGPGEIVWCHPVSYDPDDPEGYVLLEEDCRRGPWPGELSRHPL